MTEDAAVLPADPRADTLAHGDAVRAAIERVLSGGHYIQGPEGEAFEEAFAGWLGAAHAVGTASGTDAIELGLRVLDIGPGDAVVTVSHTAVATVAAIERAGALPVLVDVDPERYTLDPDCLAALLEDLAGDPGPLGGRRLRAVLPVHLYGQPADMPAILEICRRHGLRVIEDCAQAHGASLDGRRAGTWGDCAAFSFYPTKNLGALGDAGALVTGDAELAARARRLREYGWASRVSQEPGINSRLDELQAAILNAKLPHLDADNDRRCAIAEAYRAGLGSCALGLPAVAPGAHHVYHQFVVRSTQRDALQAHLRRHGIHCLVHYPMAVHQQPAYRGRLPAPGPGLGHTETLVREILSLPLYPTLPDTHQERVLAALAAWRPAGGGS